MPEGGEGGAVTWSLRVPSSIRDVGNFLHPLRGVLESRIRGQPQNMQEISRDSQLVSIPKSAAREAYRSRQLGVSIQHLETIHHPKVAADLCPKKKKACVIWFPRFRGAEEFKQRLIGDSERR